MVFVCFSLILIKNHENLECFEKKVFYFRFRKRILYFFGVEKKLGYSFDVKNCGLSIYEVSNVFWTL